MTSNRLVHLIKSPANLLAATGALALSAMTWNPLPLILYGLGEPVWLYRRLTARAELPAPISRATLEHEVTQLLRLTPCGQWTRRGMLPDYAMTYVRLVDSRDQAARIVGSRDDAAKPLEEDIVAKMDDMLRAYLMMVRERLLLHCALARIYPDLPPAPTPPAGLVDRIKRALVKPATATREPWSEEARFVSVELASREVQAKIAGFTAETAAKPDLEDVYRPIIETLSRRLEELARRARHDAHMSAQLAVFPDQFDVIVSKLATPQADVGEVVGEMKLLLEQTDDTVSFAADLRGIDAARAQLLD